MLPSPRWLRPFFERLPTYLVGQRSKFGIAILLVLLAAGFGGAAWAGGAAAPTQDVMVPPPPGFAPYDGGPAVNGPITVDVFKQLAGAGATDEIPKDELEKALEGSYGRTYFNEADEDILVILGYRLPDDDQAASFTGGATSSADADPRITKLSAADGVALFRFDDPAGPKGQMALARQGRYVFQFLVVSATGGVDETLAERLARAQLGLLPAGSRSLEAPEESDAEAASRRIGRVLPIVLGLLIVAALVARSNRKRKQADAAAADAAAAAAADATAESTE